MIGGQTSRLLWWKSYALPLVSRSAGPQFTMLMQQAGGAFPSDAVSHDWQAIVQQEGSVGAIPAGAPAGLQQHPVIGDRLFAALPDVWEAPSPPC